MTADGWHQGVHDAYYLTRAGTAIAVVYPHADTWAWMGLNGWYGGGDGYQTKEAAQKAAEDATK